MLIFSPGGCGGGDYSLRVDSIDIPELVGDRPLEVAVGAHATEYCHLQLALGQELWLSVRSHDFDAAVTVLAPDGRKVGTWEGGGIGKDALAAFAARAAGRFTLLVHSRTGPGRCVLRAVTPAAAPVRK